MCIIHKGFRGMRGIFSRFNFGNDRCRRSPQSLTKSYTKRCTQIQKPMRYILALILMFLTSGLMYSQKEMSKDEILDYYMRFEQKLSSDKDSIRIIRFNDDLENKTRNLIDSLSNNLIDTILIYSVSYPGYLSYNEKTCASLMYPIDIYLFWKQSDMFYEKIILNGCDIETVTSDSSLIVSYCINNLEYIKKEKIMPVIYSAVMSVDSTMVYSSGSVSHEPKYSIYIKSGEDYTQKLFTENDITNQENIFYDYNLNQKTFKLFKLIDAKTKE